MQSLTRSGERVNAGYDVLYVGVEKERGEYGLPLRHLQQMPCSLAPLSTLATVRCNATVHSDNNTDNKLTALRYQEIVYNMTFH